MADVILRMDSGHGETCVPDVFIDEYMPAADGEFVKVYLFLLRCIKDPSKVFSVADAAVSFGCSEGRIIDALKYWEHVGLLRLDFDSRGELSCVCFTGRLNTADTVMRRHGSAAPVSTKSPDESNAHAVTVADDTDKSTSGNIIADADRRELLMIAETYLGRTLSPTEMYKLYDWIDKFRLPAEVIDYLIDYCVTGGHNSFAYMDRVAVEWSRDGIDTLAKAREHTKEFDGAKTFDAVKRAFGITGRSLVDTEKSFVRSWSIELGMPPEIIVIACERTVLKTGRASFEYADRIVHSWHDNNVSSADDIKALDEKHRMQMKTAPAQPSQRGGSFASFDSRGYNADTIGDIEKALLKV